MAPIPAPNLESSAPKRMKALAAAMHASGFRRGAVSLGRAARRAGAMPSEARGVGILLAAACLFSPAAPPPAPARPRIGKHRDDPAVQLPSLEWVPPPKPDHTPAGCVAWLLSARLDCPPEAPLSVRELISRARLADGQSARKVLIDHGIKITPFPQREAGPACLVISNVGPALEIVFRDTPWSVRRWAAALRTLPGAIVPRDPVAMRFGFKPRVVVIPLNCIMGEDDPGWLSLPRPLSNTKTSACDTNPVPPSHHLSHRNRLISFR
jgi:hypothetical protein